MSKKRVNKKAIVSLLLVLVTLITIMGSSAMVVSAAERGFYSGMAEEKVNVVKYQNHMEDPARIIEPNWDPIGRKDIKPGEIVVKDPKIRNQSNYVAYAVIKVQIPTVMAKKYGDSEEKLYDQFEPNWNTERYQLLYSKSAITEGENSVYYYGLKKTLDPGEYSPYLFTKIQMPRFITAEEQENQIIVDGGIIRSKISSSMEFKNVQEAFECMGEFVPRDYISVNNNFDVD